MRSGILKKILASLLLTAVFLGAFHHHDDAGIHHDCPIYILQSNLAAPDITKILLLDDIELFYYPAPAPPVVYDSQSPRKSYASRAPPHFS